MAQRDRSNAPGTLPMNRAKLFKTLYLVVVVGLFGAAYVTQENFNRKGCLDRFLRIATAQMLEQAELQDLCFGLERSFEVVGIPVEVYAAEAPEEAAMRPFRSSDMSKIQFFVENAIAAYEREFPTLSPDHPIVVAVARSDGLAPDPVTGGTYMGLQNLGTTSHGEQVCIIALGSSYSTADARDKHANIAHEIFHCYQDQLDNQNRPYFVTEGGAEYAATLVVGPEYWDDPLDARIDEALAPGAHNAYDQWLLWEFLARTRTHDEILDMWESIEDLEDLDSRVPPDEFHDFVVAAVRHRLAGENGTTSWHRTEIDVAGTGRTVYDGIADPTTHHGVIHVRALDGATVEVSARDIAISDWNGEPLPKTTTLCGEYDSLLVLWSAIDSADLAPDSVSITATPFEDCDAEPEPLPAVP